MRSLFCTIALVAVAFVSGCARAKVTTEIKPDGSWSRTVSLTGPETKEGSMQMTPPLEETFVIPTGQGWKSSEEKKDGNRVLTITRVVTAGAQVNGDLSFKGEEAGKPKFSNEAVVTRTGTRYEYRETLKWSGKAPEAGNLKPEDIAQIKAALPAPLATDENAHALAMRVVPLAIPLIFGPGDPLLAFAAMHPDLAERRASQRIGTLLLRALEEQFGDKLTLVQRQNVARRMIERTFNSARPAQPDPASAADPSASASKSAGLTPLLFVVKGPGKVTSSNGDVDTLTGEVYWALYPEAASLNPVVLTAVFDTGR